MQQQNNIRHRDNGVPVIFGNTRLTINDIVELARGQRRCEINTSAEFTRHIQRGAEFLEQLLREDGVVYGVTTGYGDSCTVVIPPRLVEELPLHLTRFHGCGLGKNLDTQQAIAVMAARLASLSCGYSGVRLELLKLIETLINERIAPRIPEEGSVGASGDLTPLSYLAAVLIGEREVLVDGHERKTAEVFAQRGIKPLTLRPKEGLALMNGTAVMTALASLAFVRAQYLAKLCARITSMATIVTRGNLFHFDETLFKLKPHPGQQQIAAWIRSDVHTDEMPRNSARLQDRYSLRCAPHVIGVLQDALPWMRDMIENELNSANDNPLIDPVGEHVLHGGHFYGGHIAFVMDSMKNCVANLADLLDRQMALMVDTKFNHGLPPNLSGASSERSMINHGLKAVQIGVSAWTAEALKLTMPASVFSRSTECHNQDKVSMGTIAARDCLRVIELTEQVAAALLIAVRQAMEIRQRLGELQDTHLTANILAMQAELAQRIPYLAEDRPLEQELRTIKSLIESGHWDLYPS